MPKPNTIAILHFTATKIIATARRERRERRKKGLSKEEFRRLVMGEQRKG